MSSRTLVREWADHKASEAALENSRWKKVRRIESSSELEKVLKMDPVKQRNRLCRATGMFRVTFQVNCCPSRIPHLGDTPDSH